jgi:SagB-type dehydrogenase family enzyme
MFRDDHELAWTFHRNTSRWPFNMHGLNSPAEQTARFEEHLDAPTLALPPAALPRVGFDALIEQRHSCRQLEAAALSLLQLGTLLRAGYGVLGESNSFDGFLERPVPSGGALYPLELYVLASRVEGFGGGVLHYLPLVHAVEVLHADPLPRLLSAEMFLGQPYLANAAAILVITAVVERSMWKYEDRGYRYILLEAGHVAQNVILCATGLGLGSLPLGGFFDDDVAALLRLDPEREIPLYGIAVGHAKEGDRDARRSPASDAAQYRRY